MVVSADRGLRRFGRLLLCILFAACGLVGRAQEFTVKSFELKTTDLTAKVDPRYDLNGDPCALIRVAIACKGVQFGGMVVGTPQASPGEYLVYVPAGARRLKISHPDYLPLTYEFDLEIESYRTYELRITLPQSYMPPTPELSSQFLVLTVTPKEAMVFINDVLQTTVNGVLSKELPFGEHNYRIESQMYHPQAGTFTVGAEQKTKLQIDLAPAFGYLEVDSSPERGARVFIDGRPVGVTPFKSEQIASGTYQLQVLKEGFYQQMQTVEITDNQTASLVIDLRGSFSAISLQAANPAAEIWVSGKRYGVGSWTGRLEAGTYSVESRCAGYEPAIQSITVVEGEPQTIQLQPQVPIYGLVKVSTMPVGAVVKLDGVPIGETPLISNKVLVGQHKIEIAAPGYVPAEYSVEVGTAAAVEIGDALRAAFGVVRVATLPAGAEVYIDGRQVGVTPFSSDAFSGGTHSVRIAKAGYEELYESFELTEGGTCEIQRTLKQLALDEQRLGTAIISSFPQEATIWIDGREFGATPMTISLAEGAHEVTIGKEGYESQIQKVQIEYGKQTPVQVTLRAAYAPSPSQNPAGQPATPLYADDDDDWSGIRPTIPAATYSQLLISSNPAGCHVRVNGRDKGVTPLSLTLTPGSYEVLFYMDGYLPQERKVTIQSGRDASVSATLEADTAEEDDDWSMISSTPSVVRYGKLLVMSTPAGAAVKVDGKPSGATPLTLTLTPGAHQVEVGGKSQQVLIEADKSVSLNVAL